MVKPINFGITVKLVSSDERIIDNKGNIKVEDLSKLNGFSLKLVYTFEGLNLNKEYRGSYLNEKLKFISLPF